jgi:hypothetical protein
MGELVAVHFSVAGHFSGSVRHENLDSAGTYYNDLMNWTLYVALVSSPRNSSLISFDDTLLIAGTLESFDGLMDYDGESGAERLLNTPITGGIVIQGEYALDFIGMGTVAIRVTASGTADLNMGGLAGLSQSTSACAATVTIIYEYALAPIINEAATWGDVKTLYR